MTPTEFRIALKSNGFHPIPVNGKAPLYRGWQQLFDVSPETIEGWASDKPDHGNTGILTKFTAALDIDVTDPALNEALLNFATSWIGERGAVVKRVGRAPKVALFFRSDKPFPKQTLNLIGPDGTAQKIEFLGDGQQIVVGGIHPDTKQPYDYPAGIDLVDTRRDELPPIDEPGAAQMLKGMRGLAEKGYHYRVIATAAPRRSNGPNLSTADKFNFDEGPRWGSYLENLIDHDSNTAFAFALLRAGMDDAAASNLLHALIDQIDTADEARKQRRHIDADDQVSSARRKIELERGTPTGEPVAPEADLPLPFLNMAGWDLAAPEPIEYVVADRIPARQVCLFTGHGASGKSTIGLNLCCATVLGLDWLKSLPAFGPALFIDAEDDEQALHHRLYANVKHYGVTFRKLIDDGLHVLPMAGKDCVMATADRSGKIIATPFYKQVLGFAQDIKPKIVCIASLANVFAGEENNRSQAQQFISLLTAIAIACHGAVILIAHPSQRGMETRTGISGSTAWFNSVRAQMYLQSVDDKDDEQPSSDSRILEFKKNQYGKIDDRITLRYDAGRHLFLPETSRSVNELAREQQIDGLFLTLLRRFLASHRPISPTPRSASYGPDAFELEPEAKEILPAANRKELEAAMRRLLKNGQVLVKNFGRPSNPRPFLVLPRPSDSPIDNT